MQLAAFRCEGVNLHLIMASGIDAVTATSMDGVRLASGELLSVRLRSAGWVDAFMARVDKLLDADTAINEDSLNALAALNLNYEGSSLRAPWTAATTSISEEDDESWAHGGDLATSIKDAPNGATFARSQPPLPPPILAASLQQRPR